MRIRLAGLGLIGCAMLFGFLFIYLPIHDGPDGFMGRLRPNALLFVSLASITGLAFIVGGSPVLEAFQARPKTKGHLAVVLSILILAGMLTGLGYWQIKTRWMRVPEPVILDASPKAPTLPEVQRPTFRQQ